MCDNCADFAQATLEGANLCSGCLLRLLMSTSDASLFDRLQPLTPDGTINLKQNPTAQPGK
jgi:hypothetical protein